MTSQQNQLARFGKGYTHIIDSDGQRVALDDPRVVHVFPGDKSAYTKRFTRWAYAGWGRRCRSAGNTSAETLRRARRLCSGRECVPSMTAVGNILKDLECDRSEDEITMYLGLNQDGPCQNGAWPVMWRMFLERLRPRNVLFPPDDRATLSIMSHSPEQARIYAMGAIAGSFLDEAEFALRCVAQDPATAMERFRRETEELLQSIREGEESFLRGLQRWAARMADIPRSRALESMPRVLVFGGLNVLYVCRPVADFFVSQGIVPKVVDFSEGQCAILSEHVIRYGFEAGHDTPEAQFAALLEADLEAEADEALQAAMGIRGIDMMCEHIRGLMNPSGLMHDVHIPFRAILEAGHPYASANGITETPITVGRYLCSVAKGGYDGLVNVGCFDCQPAMNSQAIIRPLANADDVPYAAIDVEGPWLSTNQKRLLETIVVQARRRASRRVSA